MSVPTAQDEEPLEVRYSDDGPRPVRDRMPFHGSNRMDRQIHFGPLLVAAAIGFVIAVLFGPSRNAHPHDEELANLQSELQSARDRVGQLESELTGSHESVGKADAPERHAEAVAPERKEEMAPAPKRESRSELTPEEVLREEPSAKPEAAKEMEPSATTPPDPIPHASAEPLPAEPPTEPFRLALAEPQQVAAASVFDAPDSAGPAVRASSQSGAPDVAVLQALAPERAGWTTEAQPTLYWHASERTRFPCEFKLTREGGDEPLVRVQLPAPASPGIQRIELSQFGVALDEGASYRWSVSLVDLEQSGADRAIGGIRRVAPPGTVRAITDPARAPERLDALERAGLWYDALDLVTRWIDRNPGAENLVARRNAMLARVGIQLQKS